MKSFMRTEPSVLTPQLEAAKRRARELAKTFQFNEVIVLLDELIVEVRSMPVAERFSPTRKIFSTYPPPAGLNPAIRKMSERDHKRWQLERDLTELKNTILALADEFRLVVLDIEAAKID